MPQQRFYTGYSSQTAVVAELTYRKCNAAVPVLDEGTDVFAFKENRPEVARLQVKSSKGTAYVGGGCRGQFTIPLKGLRAVDEPPLFYVLAVRCDDVWADFLVIGRRQLRKYELGPAPFGALDGTSENLILRVQFRRDNVTCGRVDLSRHRNAWQDLPPLQPPVLVALAPALPAPAAPAVPPPAS
jgi:hypothetical protein